MTERSTYPSFCRFITASPWPKTCDSNKQFSLVIFAVDGIIDHRPFFFEEPGWFRRTRTMFKIQNIGVCFEYFNRLWYLLRITATRSCLQILSLRSCLSCCCIPGVMANVPPTLIEKGNLLSLSCIIVYLISEGDRQLAFTKFGNIMLLSESLRFGVCWWGDA